MANYSPPSLGNHRSLFVKPAKRGKQRAGVRLCFPYTFSPLIINHVILTIVSFRNCIGIAPLSQWMNFAI